MILIALIFLRRLSFMRPVDAFLLVLDVMGKVMGVVYRERPGIALIVLLLSNCWVALIPSGGTRRYVPYRIGTALIVSWIKVNVQSFFG